MNKVFLGIGGNIGDKHHNFTEVHRLIAAKMGPIIKSSSVYETPPWGFNAKFNFWNQVLLVETKLEAIEMLWRIQEIEDTFGRDKGTEKYASRQMDIDILYFNDEFMETEKLIVPHPLIQNRKFVLVPLVEIAPDLKHPLLRLTSVQMLENCKDQSVIKRVDEFDCH